MCRVRSVVVDEMDNNLLKLKVNRILSHENLPNIHSNNNCHTRGNGKELWLIEGEINLINPANVEQRINIWLCDVPEPSEYEFYIQEIIYYFNKK